ncbi:MAG TPA: DUF2510 domain-containing protein [Acidimicrobiales bacterium]|nr:DUF2510 domain-containing protein [Acidimicrobiales bacterium]
MSGVIGMNSLWYGTSTRDLVASAIFAVVFAALGYRISIRHRAVRGVTPWRLPSIVWAIICGLFQALGIILELIAEWTTRPQPRPSPTPGTPDAARAAFPFASRMSTTAEAIPPIEISPAPGAFVPPTAPPPDDGSGHPPLFGWYADPTKRHALRYWDGRVWSDHVADDGNISSDPI